MAEEFRGISVPEDIQSQEDALRLLGVEDGATPEEISDSMRDVFVETHPDANGTSELFQAVQLAEDALTGETEILASGGRAPDRTAEETIDISIGVSEPQGGGSPSGGGPTGPAGPTGGFNREKETEEERRSDPFGGFGGSSDDFSGESVNFSQGDAMGAEELLEEVKDILRERVGEEAIKDTYGDIANIQNVAEIITTQILQGNIDLGDVQNMVGQSDFAGSTESATGGVYTDSPSGPFSGRSSSPYHGSVSDSQYSPENVDVDDEDNEE